jgi:hypothetical protein
VVPLFVAPVFVVPAFPVLPPELDKLLPPPEAKPVESEMIEVLIAVMIVLLASRIGAVFCT